MKRKREVNLLLLVLLFCLCIETGIQKIYVISDVVQLKKVAEITDHPGKEGLSREEIRFLSRVTEVPETVWKAVTYFPVPVSTTDKKITVSFVDTWMGERTYGGKRGHEGTDLMASKNERGLYPVVSMTDGTVTQKGWLEKGGYRIGITAPGGGYFYYAHLDSYADLDEGDEVKAGDILGFMGDTGYGKEGTTGQFPVHLHVGIYHYPGGVETSMNPYWVLRYLQNYKLKCAYS